MTVPTVLEGALGTESVIVMPKEGRGFEECLARVAGEEYACPPEGAEEPIPKEQEPSATLLGIGLPLLLADVPYSQWNSDSAETHSVLRGWVYLGEWGVGNGEWGIESGEWGVGNGILRAVQHENLGGDAQSAQYNSLSANAIAQNTDLVTQTQNEIRSKEAPALKQVVGRNNHETIQSSQSSPLTNPHLMESLAPQQKPADSERLLVRSEPFLTPVSPHQQIGSVAPSAERVSSPSVVGTHASGLSIPKPSEPVEPLTGSEENPSPSGSGLAVSHLTHTLGRSEALLQPEASFSSVASQHQMVEQVAEFIERLTLAPERNRIALQLNPPELGTLEIQIRVEGSEVQAWLHADHESTRRALEQSVQQLRDQLASRGLQLTGFSVHTGTSHAHSRFYQPRETYQGFSASLSPRHATESVHLHGQWSVWA